MPRAGCVSQACVPTETDARCAEGQKVHGPALKRSGVTRGRGLDALQQHRHFELDIDNPFSTTSAHLEVSRCRKCGTRPTLAFVVIYQIIESLALL